ncbi:arsenic-transport integral membrane protein ARSB1 [Mycobacterium sp. H4Y]|nr:arsenic-transport integral membrane protein ARSB1 [Mycobacterium sp. H4Y]
MRTSGDQRGALFDGRGVRIECRRRGNVGGRSAQHHHRQQGRSDVQRLSRSSGADRGHRPRRPDGVVAAPFSRGVQRRPRSGCRRDVAGGKGGHPRPPAARHVRDRLAGGVHRVHRALAAAYGTLHGGAAGRRDPGRGVTTQAVRLPVQRGVGHAAVLRRPVHHGRRAGEDGCGQTACPRGDLRDRREHLDRDDDHPGRLGPHQRGRRQRSVCRDDGAGGGRPGPRPGRSRQPRRLVVVARAGHGLRRQPDRYRRQRQHRPARDRQPRRQSHLVLGIHPQGRGRHRRLHRAGRAVCVAAVFRDGLGAGLIATCQQRDAFDVVGQRERVEHLDLLDGVAVAEIDTDIARERRCLTTDVHHTRDTGRGEQIDDLAPGARPRWVKHRHICC